MNDWVSVTSRQKKRSGGSMNTDQHGSMITESQASKLQHRLNIDNLEEILLAPSTRKLQMEGWIYSRVLVIGEAHPNKQGWEYLTTGAFNKWGDRLLFCRIQQKI